ncbi:hypothetical protein FLA_5148 [Filimonas lacunae]|nr:hypothetical protein FLA_5148 [Filimonas lacunae]
MNNLFLLNASMNKIYSKAFCFTVFYSLVLLHNTGSRSVLLLP